MPRFSRFNHEETLNAIHIHDVLLQNRILADSHSSPSLRLGALQDIVERADEAIDTLKSKVIGRQFLKYLAGFGIAAAGAVTMLFGGLSVPIVATGLVLMIAGGATATYNVSPFAHTRQEKRSGLLLLQSAKEGAEFRSDDCIAQNLDTLLKTPNLFDSYPSLKARFKKVEKAMKEDEVIEAIRANIIPPAKP